MKTIWKMINNCDNYYVSNTGQIKSCSRSLYSFNTVRNYKEKILKPLSNKHNGYDYICIKNNKGKYIRLLIHRLVAQTFIPNPENKKEVNHINGIKTDNRVENLEWVSREQNIQHAYKNRLIKLENRSKGQDKYKHPIVQLKDGKVVAKFNSTKEASKKLGIYASTLKYACKKSKTHIYKGYEYRFEIQKEVEK